MTIPQLSLNDRSYGSGSDTGSWATLADYVASAFQTHP